ncbi:MAG: SDR family oxidoreductase [Clostridiales bacterium]|nr:SDR family oxidoreductase [Clostridiales bacterium]MBP3941826.1 SDR family oxidoreductase [Christensenellaceae bacterium]MBR2223143.1 SDR family oxidoreductase [Christensenellaceae bacterium]MBR3843528.1 SDR family oxidoreductase [Christensenellaceae bacterium]
MGRLDGKVAIVTGGNSGVGAVTAELFAKEGAKVVISARRLPQLEEVAEKIRANGGEVLAVPTDVSKVEDVENLVNKTVEAYGKIDILVNNAGVLEEGLKPVDKFSDEDLEWVLGINTKGCLYCTRAVLREMVKTNSGSIINLDSVAGQFGTGGAAYVTSKAAVIGLTKHTAMRFAGTGIRCNSVNPSTIVTPMTMKQDPAKLDQDMFGQMRKHMNLSVPPCMPADVANILLFLASDESRAITGQVIVSDFGATL